MRTLNLVLTYKWFDKIKSGEKTVEYRACSEYWDNRFKYPKNENYDEVRFQRGYTKNAEKIVFYIRTCIYRSDKPNDLNLPKAWVIELGDRIKVTNENL